MLSGKMQRALNGQLNAELYSAYLYWSMAAYLKSQRLPGLADSMGDHAYEEFNHAMKFFDYVNGRGGRVTLAAIDGPPVEWGSPRAAFEHVLQHEQKVTGLIHEVVKLAAQEKDQTTGDFLEWFVKEQLEEEESAEEVLEKVKAAGADLSALDGELAARAFKPPAASS